MTLAGAALDPIANKATDRRSRTGRNPSGFTFTWQGTKFTAVMSEGSRSGTVEFPSEESAGPNVLAAAELFPPELCVAPDFETMSQEAARRVMDRLRQKPDCLVCATTGASPTRLYELLVAVGQGDPSLFRQVRWIKPDEWAGLGPTEAGSNERYLQERLLRPLGVTADRYMGWDGLARDPRAECRRVAEWLRRFGPIDLCILGVGPDGHLAMNEPGPSWRSGPHAVELSTAMRQHPMLGGAGDRVRFGYTLGMGDVLASRWILLLASGTAKAPVLSRFFRERRVTTQFPVSVLWLHRAVTICCDAAAASALGGSEGPTVVEPEGPARR